MGIELSTEGGIATIAFARPDKKNAITAAMYAAMADGLAAAAADPAVRAVLITGSAECFTAGNDLQDFLANPPSGEDSPVWRFLHGLAGFGKPVVAAPCGVAVGVGTTLLMHCDLVYAGDNARFSVPFAALGLCPEAASSLLMPAVAGWQRAAEKLLLGEPFGAEEAREMGIVNRVLPAAEAIGFARAQAVKLAALPPASLRETKRLMKGAMREAIPARMAEEGAVFGRMLRAPEAREAFTAFFEKRRPDFSRFD
ncbi:MAG: enoyl-CoA hydratase [Burkholderiales bacterium]|nr:MAG: enoyl-CoA hydratase [Burkholderiales bacterium]